MIRPNDLSVYNIPIMCESAEESYNLGVRYRTIKKRLDSLGYRHALSLDSLPLIEKLLADLIQTTESLKHFKAVAEDKIESCRQSLSGDSYNYDNTKLIEECNQLHTQLIEVKEKNLIQSKDLKRKIQRLESECSDLQSASSRNLKRIKDLELESSNKSKRIQELLGKCCKPIISNAGLASKKRSVYPLKRPVIESDPLPTDSTNGDIEYPSLTKVKPQTVDLVRMADRKISSLNHEVIRLENELSLQTDNVDTLRTQLAMREKEINRLKKLHDSGRSYNAPINECNCRKKDPNCGQCNFTNRRSAGNYSHSVCNKMADLSELKVLQQAKLNLEQQLRDALDKQHDAMSHAMKLAERNEELEKELRDIDHVALAVEADCNSTVKQNNKRVSQLQEKLENAMTKVRELENSLLVEKRMSQELRADLEGCKLEKRNIQRALDSALDEKKHLTDRINELTIIENDLNAEIGRLSKHNETQRHEIVELEFVNDSLKKQLHKKSHAQSEKKKKGRMSKDSSPQTNNNVAASNGQRRSVLSSTSNNNINNNNNNSSKDNEYNTDNNQKLSDNATNNGLKRMTDESRKLIEQLERDRDHYKDQWNKLNEQMQKNSDTENAELWSQICDLKHQLNEKEAQIAELQRDKRDLSRDKFDLENRVQISQSQARNPCSYCNVCRSMSACVCPSASSTGNELRNGSKLVLSRLERERDSARAEIEHLTEERDILHERLKLATEAHTCEQRRLRDRLRELETKLEDTETEKQNILIAQGNRQSTLSGIEEQLNDARNELRKTKQELATQRTQYFQLRALQDQTDQALGDVQSQLIQSESELSKALERNKNLDQQQLQLDNQVMELKQEISNLRSNMARLDHEKDQLLMSLDEKTERIAALEREVMIKEQQTMGVDHQLRDLQRKNQICMDQSAEQERQLRNMQMEIENYQRQLCAASAEREHAIQENKRMQNDLAAVTYDSRTLQRELEASRAEIQDLKRQLQTYVSEVRRAEELLDKKENERTEMLNHFRSLSLEATVLENNNHSLESEAAEAKGALQSARDRALDLEGQLADKECQIRRYELQITELTNNVAKLETQVRQQIENRSRVEAELHSLRDLCVQLDGRKDSLQKDVENTSMMKAQYMDEISKLKIELSAMNNQRNRDHAAVESLEKLLEQESRKSMDCHRTNQELQNEIGRLKDRVSELQTKLSAQSAELRSYQNQAAEYSKQISDLRRQVTDERFNRAKNGEEHRRTNQYSGDTSAKHVEYKLGDATSGTTPMVTFDSTAVRPELSISPFRHPQKPSMANKESTRLSDIIHEAEKTNRFDTGYGSHKDSHLKDEHTIVFAHGPGTGEPTQSTIAVPGASGICVRASVQEDENHKDIRLRITEQPSMSQRPLRGDAVMQDAPSTSSHYQEASRDMFESYTSLENRANDADVVENIDINTDEGNRREEIPDQMQHENILQQRTSDERGIFGGPSTEREQEASVSVIDDSTESSRKDKKTSGEKKAQIPHDKKQTVAVARTSHDSEQEAAVLQFSDINRRREAATQISGKTKQKNAGTQILVAQKKMGTQISKESKEAGSQFTDEAKQNESYTQKTKKEKRKKPEVKISGDVAQKEPCGCDVDNRLPGCIADERSGRHVEINTRRDDDDDDADADADKKDADEGYNTSRVPKSPERIALENPNGKVPIDHISVEKLYGPATKAQDDSHSPRRNLRIPVIVTHWDQSPTRVNVEDIEIEMPKTQLSPHIDGQPAEDGVSTRVIRERMRILTDLSSKEFFDNAGKGEKMNRDEAAKRHDNTHLVIGDVSKFEPPRSSTPAKALTGTPAKASTGKAAKSSTGTPATSSTRTPAEASTGLESIIQSTPSRKIEKKPSRSSGAYIEETTDYSSSDESSRQSRTSRNQPLDKSHDAHDGTQRSGRQKKTTGIVPKSPPSSREKSFKIHDTGKDFGSTSRRNKTFDMDRQNREKSYDDDPRTCEKNKCRNCPLSANREIPTHLTLSSRASTNVETQSSNTEVDAGTSYSASDVATTSSHTGRQIRTPSHEKSKTTHGDRSRASEVYEIVIQGPAECFVESPSIKHVEVDEIKNKTKTPKAAAATSRIPHEQSLLRSRTSPRDHTRRQSQSSSRDVPVVDACTRDICHDC